MLRMTWNILFISLLCWSPRPVFAKETDNFTGRYQRLEDSTAVLDQEMNNRLKEVEKAANKEKFPCDENGFRKLRVLFHEQNQDTLFVGSMESWAEDSDKVKKREASPKESIYNGVLENGIFFDRLKLASTIKVNGTLVGTDKLGHFMDEGFEFFTTYRRTKYNMKTALSGPLGEEKGMYGQDSTGVISYGDISANYQGILFYQNLVEGPHPYFGCVNNQWKQVRNFTFADYVDASWDEGINCSKVVSNPDQFKKNIEKLEADAKKSNGSQRYQCPVDPALCLEIYQHYRGGG
ncbi:MAG TPA: hypothetical protein VN132_06330, partial [Bdellovibrio sp.]|nr:hypothetical protein [Bdellovibrio sp.]